MKDNTDYITTEIIEKYNIAILTLNNPEKNNAFDNQIIKSLQEKLNTLAHNPAIRFLILRANGKHFCAGADINWMKAAAHYTQSDNLNDATALGTLLQTLYQFPKPTIALVQGAAYGGGAGLACACDLVLATESTTFCFSEAKLGLIPAVISPYVIEAIGARQAKAYFLTAEIMDAHQAVRLGLCHQIIPENILINNIINIPIIQNLLHNGPEAISHIKKWVNNIKSYSAGNHNTLQITAERIADIRTSPEGKEGLSAFIEKREPNWIIK